MYRFSAGKSLVTTVLLGLLTDRIAISKALGSASLSSSEMVLWDLWDKSNGHFRSLKNLNIDVWPSSNDIVLELQYIV